MSHRDGVRTAGSSYGTTSIIGARNSRTPCLANPSLSSISLFYGNLLLPNGHCGRRRRDPDYSSVFMPPAIVAAATETSPSRVERLAGMAGSHNISIYWRLLLLLLSVILNARDPCSVRDRRAALPGG